jgi:hypothetical protein
MDRERNSAEKYTEGLAKDGYQGRKLELKKAMTAIHAYERELSRALLSALEAVPGLRLYGLTDPDRLEERVATFSFRLKDLHPRVVAEKLADDGIYVWDGNYYALNVSERLGVEESRRHGACGSRALQYYRRSGTIERGVDQDRHILNNQSVCRVPSICEVTDPQKCNTSEYPNKVIRQEIHDVRRRACEQFQVKVGRPHQNYPGRSIHDPPLADGSFWDAAYSSPCERRYADAPRP